MRYTQEGFQRLAEAAKTRRGYQEGSEDLMRKLKAYVERGS